MTIQVTSTGVNSGQGVPISVTGIAQVIFGGMILENIGYREVAIQLFRFALKTRKAALETARIPSLIHKTGHVWLAWADKESSSFP